MIATNPCFNQQNVGNQTFKYISLAGASFDKQTFNIVHRSLHPKNILLNSYLKIYIKDCGFILLKDETFEKEININSIEESIITHSIFGTRVIQCFIRFKNDSTVSQKQVGENIKSQVNNIINPNKRYNERLTPEQTEYLSMVQSSAGSLLTMINDILDWNRLRINQAEFLAPDRYKLFTTTNLWNAGIELKMTAKLTPIRSTIVIMFYC
ncbi:hypothetical protein ACTA71_000016 [Dictyostelium dimigraforme]